MTPEQRAYEEYRRLIGDSLDPPWELTDATTRIYWRMIVEASRQTTPEPPLTRPGPLLTLAAGAHP